MKILRIKTFSDPDKKEKEKKDGGNIYKKAALISSIPLAYTQVKTRIDDVIAKRDAVKKAKEIRNNRNKHIKDFERIAKDKLDYAKAEEGVGSVSDKIGKMLDDMGIKREKQPFRTQEDKKRLEETINHAKKNLKDEKVLIDSASKLVSMTNRDVRDLRLKNNKKLRKYGAALSAGMVVGSGIGIAAKKHKNKKEKKDENTKN